MSDKSLIDRKYVRTDADGSTIDNTHSRLSVLNVLIVSVRPCWNNLVNPVSYVAVNDPRIRYQASCMAICMYASGANFAVVVWRQLLLPLRVGKDCYLHF